MIRIDLNDPLPLEEQIAGRLRQAIAQGSVGPGEDLPSVRQLAGDLGVHWNTVARAYRRLADEGLLTVRRGRGAVTRSTPDNVRMGRAALRERFCETVAAGVLGGLSIRTWQRHSRRRSPTSASGNADEKSRRRSTLGRVARGLHAVDRGLDRTPRGTGTLVLRPHPFIR